MSIQRVEVIKKDGLVMGAMIYQGDKSVFLDRDVEATNHDVALMVAMLTESDIVTIDGNLRVRIGDFFVYQLGKLMLETITGGHAPIEVAEPSDVHLQRLGELKDDGNIQKSHWRFLLYKFAMGVFPTGVSEDDRVIFMPGLGGQEYDMWRKFGFIESHMYLVEGHASKCHALHQMYPQARYIDSLYGEEGMDFPTDVVSSLGQHKVGVVSLDTESLFSEKLFYDTVQILSRLNTREDFVVSVNLVTRFSNRKAVDFIRMFNTRYHTQYSLDGNARETIMKNLGNMLEVAVELKDIELVRGENSSYVGGSSTRMEYTFLHFRSK